MWISGESSQVSTGLQVLPGSTCADFALSSGGGQPPLAAAGTCDWVKKELSGCGNMRKSHVTMLTYFQVRKYMILLLLLLQISL